MVGRNQCSYTPVTPAAKNPCRHAHPCTAAYYHLPCHAVFRFHNNLALFSLLPLIIRYLDYCKEALQYSRSQQQHCGSPALDGSSWDPSSQTCPGSPADTLSPSHYMLAHGLPFLAMGLSVTIATTLISRSYKVRQHDDSVADDSTSSGATGQQQPSSGSDGDPQGSNGGPGAAVPSPQDTDSEEKKMDLSAGRSDDGQPILMWPFENFGITLGMQHIPGLGSTLGALSAWLDDTSRAVPAGLALKMCSFSLSMLYAVRVFLARIDHEVCSERSARSGHWDRMCSDGGSSI